jgi:subtilisin family serine protease
MRMTNTPFGWDAFPGTTFTQADKRTFEPVTIAVLDTKIDASHPDWVNAGGSSPDAADGGQLVLDDARDWVPQSHQSGAALYHGTFVAGLAAAAANGADTVGVGFAARVLPLTVVDGSGMTNAADLADAIVYAWSHGARIINLSLGIVGDSAAVRAAIQTVSAGTASRPASLVVAAAGNNTGSTPFYPGSYPGSMSVAGTDADDRPAPCSNHNENVSVSAPADRLVGLAPMPGRMMRAVCGTSAATPQVSGLAALLFAQDPSRTPAQVRRIIERSADDLGAPGRDDRFGHGRINVERALRTDGPVSTGAAGTVVPGSGGTTTISAVATSPRGVRAAQVIFDRPDATPIPMKADDGSFGGTTETLRASVPVPAGTAAGPHTIWVRAFDGETWGATTVGVVAVDARAPTISGAAVTGGPRLTGEPIRVSFTVSDDYSTTFAHGIEIRSTATNAVAHRAINEQTSGGGQVYEWLPGLDVPGGHYTVKIAVADRAGNVSTTQIGAIIA